MSIHKLTFRKKTASHKLLPCSPLQILAAAGVLAAFLVMPETVPAANTDISYKPVTNPVFETANDPWVVKHDDCYYYCFAARGNGIRVRQIDNLDQITSSDAAMVWRAGKGDPCSKEIWAPELHYIDGDWYIYFAASDGMNENHRMYVLKGTSQDPTQPFELVGKISDATDRWAIDGTPFTYKGEHYFVWSGWEGDTNGCQKLYIAHMDTPVSLDSERVCISEPDLDWEQSGMPIEEGPEVLTDEENEKVTLVFSASGSWTDDYCLGKLVLSGDDDPMDPASWIKAPEPILVKKEGAYGPGHCSFVEADDDSLWVVYHCNLDAGSGWGGRSCWIGPVSYEQGELTIDGPVLPGEIMQLACKQ